MTKLPHSIVELQMFMVKSQLSWLHTLHSFFHCLLVLFHGKIPTYRSRLRGKPQLNARWEAKDPAFVGNRRHHHVPMGNPRSLEMNQVFSLHGKSFWRFKEILMVSLVKINVVETNLANELDRWRSVLNSQDIIWSWQYPSTIYAMLKSWIGLYNQYLGMAINPWIVGMNQKNRFKDSQYGMDDHKHA